jgi:anti-sigma factor RsiW
MAECKHIREEFSALLDDELDIETKATVEEHLSNCSSCLRELGGFKQVGDQYAALEVVPAPDNFEEELRKRLRPKPLAFLRSKRAVRWQLLPLTAAATALVAVGSIFALQQLNQGETTQLAKSTPNTAMAPPLPTTSGLAEVAKEAQPILSEESKPEARLLAEEITAAQQALPIVAATAAAVADKVGETPRTPSRQVLVGRAFILTDGVWREQPYLGEEPKPLLRESAAFTNLLAQHPDLQAIADLGPKVLFRVNQVWYLLQPLSEE